MLYLKKEKYLWSFFKLSFKLFFGEIFNKIWLNSMKFGKFHEKKKF